MSDPTTLASARATLRQLLQDGSLETTVEAWVRLASSTVRVATMGRGRLGILGASLMFFLVTAASGLAAALIAIARADQPFVALEKLMAGRSLTFYFWASAVAVAQAFVAIFYSRRLRQTIAGSVLEAMDNVDDIRDLRRWLLALFDKRRQLRRSLAMACVLSVASVTFMAYRGSPYLGLDTVAFIVSCWTLGSVGLYFLPPSLGLATKLSRYRFQLFPFDAAKSPLIEDVAELVQETLFVSVLIATLFSGGLFYFGFESADNKRPFLLLAPWVPILAVFAYYQYSLATIILRSQRRSLQQIYKLIEAEREKVLAGGSDSGLKSLLAVYDKTKGSSSLAFDPKGAISFITTMLVPLVTFVVGWWR